METSVKAYIVRWVVFVKERFPPLKHFALIFFFYGANALVSAALVGAHDIFFGFGNVLGFMVVLFMFFHLRIFDEIKDYQTDQTVHPERPLARGLIAVSEAQRTAFSLIAVEILVSLFLGRPAFVGAGCVAVYSLMMYREFFIGPWLRPRLSTYALTHTVVAGWMALYVYASITQTFFWQIPFEFGLFVIANWMIFNVFEYGRKTFAKEEEKETVESYTKLWGSWGAASVVALMAFVASLVAWLIGKRLALTPIYYWFLTILFLSLVIAAIDYGSSNKLIGAKRFRAACSAFILLYNVIIVIGMLMKWWLT